MLVSISFQKTTPCFPANPPKSIISRSHHRIYITWISSTSVGPSLESLPSSRGTPRYPSSRRGTDHSATPTHLFACLTTHRKHRKDRRCLRDLGMTVSIVSDDGSWCLPLFSCLSLCIVSHITHHMLSLQKLEQAHIGGEREEEYQTKR